MKWNGKDRLMTGSARSPWTLRARCITLGSFPTINSTAPHEGRFEILIDTPRTLLAAQDLEFEVEAIGPKKSLSVKLRARLEPPEEPEQPGVRRRKVPEVREIPQRPYMLKLIGEKEWDSVNYWNKPAWDAQSVACFVAPTKKDPLTLVVNKDFGGLETAREEMVKRGLLESTIEERLTKYHTHIALHLYAMYRHRRQLENSGDAEYERLAEQMEDLMDAEVQRVATTLLRLLP
jgi:hypothetical protein